MDNIFKFLISVDLIAGKTLWCNPLFRQNAIQEAAFDQEMISCQTWSSLVELAFSHLMEFAFHTDFSLKLRGPICLMLLLFSSCGCSCCP